MSKVGPRAESVNESTIYKNATSLLIWTLLITSWFENIRWSVNFRYQRNFHDIVNRTINVLDKACLCIAYSFFDSGSLSMMYTIPHV